MITAVFNESDTARASGLWQWDYGQTLRIQGLSLPVAVEIHFALQETGGESIPRVGITKDGVTDVVIPDSMLENGGTTNDYYIYAWVYLSDETSGETIKHIKMLVKSRPKPQAFAGTDETSLGSIMAAVNKIADEKADGFEINGTRFMLKRGQDVIHEEEMNVDGGTFDDWGDN